MTCKNHISIDFPMPIRTKRLLIRPIMPEDSLLVNEALVESYTQFQEWFPWIQRVPTQEESEITAHKFYDDFLIRKNAHFVVFDDGYLIGMCSYTFEWELFSAKIGYWCRFSEQGKGYLREAVAGLVLYAFKQLSLKRLTILCDEENQRSIAIPKNLGFNLETKAKGLIAKPGKNELRTGCCYVRFDAKGLEAWKTTW